MFSSCSSYGSSGAVLAVQSDRDGIRACMAVIQCQNPRQVHGKVAGKLRAVLRRLRPTLQVGWCWQVGMSSDAWLGVSSVCWLSSTFGQVLAPSQLCVVEHAVAVLALQRAVGSQGGHAGVPAWRHAKCMRSAKVQPKILHAWWVGMHCCSGGLPSCCCSQASSPA